MSYTGIWRLFMGTIPAMALLAALGWLIQAHPFALFGSAALSRFIVGHWLFICIAWAPLLWICTSALILFSPRQTWPWRIALFACAMLIPLFYILYWIVWVELPPRRRIQQSGGNAPAGA